MKSRVAAFEPALAALPGSQALTTRLLKAFSQLNEKQLSELQAAWGSLDDDRRAYLVAKLRAMAEVDIRLDYTAIFRFALTDIDERVRRTAIEGLAEDESTSLIDLLAVLLRSDSSPKVQAAAAQSLGRYMHLSVMDKLSARRHEQVYSALMGALLSSPEASPVRRAALRSLAYVSNEEVDLHIRDAYASNVMPLCISAIYAMGRSNNRKYRQAVMNELHSAVPAMRREAARACGELEISEAVPELAQLVDDADTQVCRVALAALGQIAGDDARLILERAARSSDPHIARSAEDALAEHEFLYGDLKFSLGPFDEIMGTDE